MPHTLTLRIDGQDFDCVTFLDAAEVPAGGPPQAALVGRVPSGTAMTPESLEVNPGFLALLHDAIAEKGPEAPVLVAAAERQKSGWLYVLDLRTPPGKEVTGEDLIGAFSVEEGRIVPGSYRANEAWRALGKAGLFKLPTWLGQLLRARLAG